MMFMFMSCERNMTTPITLEMLPYSSERINADDLFQRHNHLVDTPAKTPV
jgi:hypothetical protein